MQSCLSTTGALVEGINVTPLIDVILVLLIISMIVVPLMGSPPAFLLPTAENFAASPDQVEFTLLLEFGGGLHLNGTPLPWGRLDDELALFHASDPGGIPSLEVDRRLSYRWVDKVLELARQAGLRQVAVVALRGELH